MSNKPRSRSWRVTLATLALCALAPALWSQRAQPTPAPLFVIEWGMSADSLVRSATSAGWSFMAIDEDGDYAFHGKLEGEEALLFATIGEEGLTRVLVSVTPHAEAEVTFHRIADTLQTYFGPAALTTKDEEVRPAPSMLEATAWQGVMMGLRRDRRILILFTCPATSPALPVRGTKFPIA
jgi:hypothetical protein